MILVKPRHEILFISPDPLKFIERAGRICYKSEAKITEKSAKTFVRKLIKREHHSVIEHTSMSVLFICDRGVTHELVRHRLASFSQESTRYCNYKGGVTFVIPPWLMFTQKDLIFEDSQIVGHQIAFNPVAVWLDSMLYLERKYKALISAGGWSPQQARSVLPNSLKTEIVMTANLREWMHIFKLRCSKAAHPQMRELMLPLLREVKTRIPIIFTDI